MKKLFSLLLACSMFLCICPAALATPGVEWIVGDLDVDGEVTSADAVYLLYHTLFADRYPISESCDYDGDGGLTSADAVYLLYHTLFAERYPLEPKKLEYDAPIHDFGGKEYRILTEDFGSDALNINDVLVESTNGDSFNDAVYLRNQRLAETYHLNISTEKLTKNFYNTTREPLLAGEYIADAFLASPSELMKFTSDVLLLDLNELENIHLEKSWFDQKATRGINIGEKIYFVVGDGTTLDERAYQVVFFNYYHISRHSSSQLDLYEEVRQGNWTVEKMYQLVNSTARDLNDDGLIFPGEDVFGMYAETGSEWYFVVSQGITLGNHTDAGWKIPSRPKQELVAAWEGLRPLLTTEKRMVEDDIEPFQRGLSTFYVGCLGNYKRLTGTGFSFGVLPLPKQDQEQEHYITTASMDELAAFAIPATVRHSPDFSVAGFSSGQEQAAYLLEAYSYISSQIVTSSFEQELRCFDEGAKEMFVLLQGNLVLDPTVGYNMGGINIFGMVGSNNQNGIPGIDIKYHTFTSSYATYVSPAQKVLKDYQKYL